MKYLYWRGRVLWSRFPLGGDYPPAYSLDIKTTGTPADKRRCLTLGEKLLGGLRTKKHEGRLFDKKDEYDPKIWRMFGRYWVNHLQYTKSGRRWHSPRANVVDLIKLFGHIRHSAFSRSRVKKWRNSQLKKGLSVNYVNQVTDYLKACFSYAHGGEEDSNHRTSTNVLAGLRRLKGGKVRQYVLTPERFERYYGWLVKTDRLPFALLYLAIWESGRRPSELSELKWDENVQQRCIDGHWIHCFVVQGEGTKNADPDVYPITARLLLAMQALPYRTGFIFSRYGKGENCWIENKQTHYESFMRSLKAAFSDEDVGVARDGRRGYITQKCEVELIDQNFVKPLSGHKSDSAFIRYRITQMPNLVKITHPELYESEGEDLPPKKTDFIQFPKTGS